MADRKVNNFVVPPLIQDPVLYNYLSQLPLWISKLILQTVTFNPASVAAQTTVRQSVSVSEAGTGDVVLVQKPTNTAGITVNSMCTVTASGTVSVEFVNVTAGAIDPPSEGYIFLIMKV